MIGRKRASKDPSFTEAGICRESGTRARATHRISASETTACISSSRSTTFTSMRYFAVPASASGSTATDHASACKPQECTARQRSGVEVNLDVLAEKLKQQKSREAERRKGTAGGDEDEEGDGQ